VLLRRLTVRDALHEPAREAGRARDVARQGLLAACLAAAILLPARCDTAAASGVTDLLSAVAAGGPGIRPRTVSREETDLLPLRASPRRSMGTRWDPRKRKGGHGLP